MIGMALDITERQEADEWSARLMTAIEQAGEAVAITDGRGKISYSNSAFCNLVKMSREGVIGKGIELLEGTNHDAAFFRAIASVGRLVEFGDALIKLVGTALHFPWIDDKAVGHSCIEVGAGFAKEIAARLVMQDRCFRAAARRH